MPHHSMPHADNFKDTQIETIRLQTLLILRFVSAASGTSRFRTKMAPGELGGWNGGGGGGGILTPGTAK